MPLLKGETLTNWDNGFYSEYTMINYCLSYMRSYRTENWKLVRDFKNPDRDEFYNIAKDPEENINLIYDSRQDIQKKIDELDSKIEETMNRIDDSLLDTLSAN